MAPPLTKCSFFTGLVLIPLCGATNSDYTLDEACRGVFTGVIIRAQAVMFGFVFLEDQVSSAELFQVVMARLAVAGINLCGSNKSERHVDA